MAIQHSAIPDAQRHEAKGASTATNGQVLKANGNGTTSFVNPSTLSNITIASSLEAQSTTTQNPLGTDNPYQVLWGSGNSNSDATVASNGVITITNAGLYLITVNLAFGKPTDVGISKLVARLLLNGLPVGYPVATQIDAGIEINPVQLTLFKSLAASDTITAQIIRDSTGANEGGLYAFDPALAGWANTPSAAVLIQKIGGAS